MFLNRLWHPVKILNLFMDLGVKLCHKLRPGIHSNYLVSKSAKLSRAFSEIR